MTPGIEINEKLWQLVWWRGRKKSVAINVLILVGLKRYPGAGSWNSLEGEWGEEMWVHLTSWDLFNNREKKTFPFAYLPLHFCQLWGLVCLQVYLMFADSFLLCLYGSPIFWHLWISAALFRSLLLRLLAALWVQIPLETESAGIFVSDNKMKREVAPKMPVKYCCYFAFSSIC